MERLEAARGAVSDIALHGVRTGVSLGLSALETRTSVKVSDTPPGHGFFPDEGERAAAEDKFRAHAEAIAFEIEPKMIISKVFDD